MSRIKQITLVTGGLAVAGALTGATSSAIALSVVGLGLLREIPFDLLAPAGAIGAAFGAVVAPAISWAVLRHEPIGRAIAAVAIGSGVGGAIGVALGASVVNPYIPMSLLRAPVPQGLLGALIGAGSAAIIIRILGRRATAPDSAG